MNILADASLSGLADFFSESFNLYFFHNQEEVKTLLKGMDVLLCRSTLKVNQTLLQSFQPQCIATASSGVDHIDTTFLKHANITLFDAKGSNAQSVADYVLSCIASIEKNHGLKGRRVGIIGYGAVGEAVAARLKRFHFEIACFDPLRGLGDKDFKGGSLQEILAQDIICIHPNLHDEAPYPSRHLLGRDELGALKPQTVVINASRGDIVSEEALLQIKPPIFYCTDVYTDEPNINPSVVAYATLCTPHIAGHSLEAKSNALRILSDKLHLHFGLLTSTKKNASKAQVDTILFKASEPSWGTLALSAYDPVFETLQLKTAVSAREAFLSLRKAHCHRHDFKF